MSLGRSFNAMEFALHRLLRDIRVATATLEAQGGAPQVDEPKHKDFWGQLEVFEERLRGVQRGMDHAGSHVSGRGMLARQLRRGEARFRANQSFQSHKQREGEVKVLAREVQEALFELYRRAHGGKLMRNADKLGQQIEQFLENIQGSSDALAVSLQADARGLQQQIQSAATPVDTPLQAYITFIMLLVTWFKRMREERARKG